MKVLYVCPFAHYSGHHPHVATLEPHYLKKIGLDVTLLTFSGIINGTQVDVNHRMVLTGHPNIQNILKKIRIRTLPRWILMFTEMVLTLIKAIQIQRNEGYDVLHLRDGEPFIFLSHLLSLPYRNIKWFVSLTAAIIFKPKLSRFDFIHRPFVYLYTVALYFWINNNIWKALYKFSMRRNKHIYAPQNIIASEKYKQYMNGIFKGNVECIELGVDNHVDLPDKILSRKHLGLPLDKFILLSFGAPNAGKDMDTIFNAVSRTDAFIVHGGTHTFSLGSSPIDLVKKYNVENKSKIFIYFISEEEKPYFFGAADVIVLSYTKAFASTSSMMWEAARFGLPAISSDANSLGEDISKYGLGILFKAEDSNSLLEKINCYKTLTQEEIKRIKDNCKSFVTSHSDIEWAKKCVSVYDRLMNEK